MEAERLISTGCRAFLSDDIYSTHPHYYRDCLLVTRLGSSAAPATTGILILLIGFHRYVFKESLLPAVYGSRYTNLKSCYQRQFSLLHLDLIVRLISLASVFKPLFLVAFKGSHWSDPYSPGWDSTLGDVVSIAVYSVSAFKMFELLHVDDLKLLIVLHHIGTIMMIQGFLVMAYSLPAGGLARILDSKTIADIALFWILFDGILGIASHVTLILRRGFLPEGNKQLISRFHGIGYLMSVTITTIEPITIMYLVGLHWVKLPSIARLVIFVLQVLFTFAKIKVCSRVGRADVVCEKGSGR